MKKEHLPNIDSLRSIACFLVIFHHCYIYLGLNSKIDSNVLNILKYFIYWGDIGVNFFFVLSGFLITFLLFKEKITHRTIAIKKYYIRRILRIWPLYYLTSIIGLFILPLLIGTFDWSIIKQHILSIALFFYNFDRINSNFCGLGNDVLGVLWSVSVEEQFYLLWPLVISFLNSFQVLIFSFSLCLASLIFRSLHLDNNQYLLYHTFSVMSDMAYGSMLAYFSLNKNDLKDLVNKYLGSTSILFFYILGFASIIYLKFFNTNSILVIFERIIIDTFFVFIIFEQLYLKYSFLKFDNINFLKRTGKYTYALYCLHYLPLMISMKGSILIIQKLNQYFPHQILYILNSIFWTFLCFSITYFISYITYHYFEKPILQLKERFSV